MEQQNLKMTSCPESSCIDYDEDEVFFGPITDNEKKKILMYEGRKTEVYTPRLRENGTAYDDKQTFNVCNGGNQTYEDLNNSNLFSDASKELLPSLPHATNKKYREQKLSKENITMISQQNTANDCISSVNKLCNSKDTISNITNESLKCVPEKCPDKLESNKKLSCVNKIFDICVSNDNTSQDFAQKMVDDILLEEEFNVQESQNEHLHKILHRSCPEPIFNEIDIKSVTDVTQNKSKTGESNNSLNEMLSKTSQKTNSDYASFKTKLEDTHLLPSTHIEKGSRKDESTDDFNVNEKKWQDIPSSEEMLDNSVSPVKSLDFCSNKYNRGNLTNIRYSNSLFLQALDLHDLSVSESNSRSLPLRNSLISLDLCSKIAAPDYKHLLPVLENCKLKENIPENYQTTHFSNDQNVPKSRKLQEESEPFSAQTSCWTSQSNGTQQVISATPTKIPVLQNRTKLIAQMHVLEKGIMTSRKNCILMSKKKVSFKGEQKEHAVYHIPAQTKSVQTPFRTPLTPMTRSKMQGKSNQKISSHKQWNVISPVAKYIQEQPPPPLIQVVKPKKKIVLGNVGEAKMTNSCYCQNFFHAEQNPGTPALPPARYKAKQGIKTNECTFTNTNMKVKSRTPSKVLLTPPSLSLIRHRGASRVVYGTDYLPNDISTYDPSGRASTLNRNQAQHSEEKLTLSKMEMSLLEHVKLFHSNTIEY